MAISWTLDERNELNHEHVRSLKIEESRLKTSSALLCMILLSFFGHFENENKKYLLVDYVTYVALSRLTLISCHVFFCKVYL